MTDILVQDLLSDHAKPTTVSRPDTVCDSDSVVAPTDHLFPSQLSEAHAKSGRIVSDLIRLVLT